jgi:acetyl-CoA synthetase
MLMQQGNDWIDKYDLSSLRVIATAGEICDASTWHWLNQTVGHNKVEILDSWWQTETGSPMINPRPSKKQDNIPPGMSARPFYGINPKLFDSETKKEILGVGSGILTIKEPWPAIARTIYNDHNRYIETYFTEFPGIYTTGDGGRRDKNGFYQITGRTDDVINIAGHRLSTSEIENILAKNDYVSEVAVIGADHKVKGKNFPYETFSV